MLVLVEQVAQLTARFFLTKSVCDVDGSRRRSSHPFFRSVVGQLHSCSVRLRRLAYCLVATARRTTGAWGEATPAKSERKSVPCRAPMVWYSGPVPIPSVTCGDPYRLGATTIPLHRARGTGPAHESWGTGRPCGRVEQKQASSGAERSGSARLRSTGFLFAGTAHRRRLIRD